MHTVIHTGTIGIASNAQCITTFFVGLQLNTLVIADKAADAAAVKLERDLAVARHAMAL